MSSGNSHQPNVRGLRKESVKKGLYTQKHQEIKNNLKKTRSPFKKELN
jgi:hypothetical protein